MEKLIIIDGNSILNRAFYALPVLSVNGVYSNAVYGFANMLIKAITEIKPRYCVVAFDVKSPTFRHELYKDYKATRKGMPAELASQLPIVKQMLDVMNIKVLEKAGLEADDVIGTLSKRFKTQKIIVTGDKDCLQLVDPTTEVYLTKKGLSEVEIVDVAALNLKWKTSPSQFIDLKALMGDTSDNIPGCAGVGEKTAQELITLYGSIDGIYKNIDKITGKLKEKLEVSKDNVYLSFKLSAINTNVDIDCLLHECELKYPFGNQVYSFFEKYSFKSLLKRTDIFSADVFGHTNQEEVIKEVPTIALKNLDIIKQSKTIAIVESADVFVALDNTKNYKLEIKKDLISNGFDYSEILDAISGKDAIVFDKKKMLQKGYKFKNVVGDAKIANFLLTNNTGVIEKPSSFFDLPQKIKDFGLEELYNN
ncbi:MAG: DNA polymerase I, partial [Firmicutes bacterium]|nr:DNA polymerase I [Bacillota bacterium]